MRVKAGDKIVDFEIEDLNGNLIKLSDYKDKKVLLSFYRYASCPLCNLRVHNLIENNDLYQKQNLEILSFFESPKESMVKYVGSQQPAFSLIPDPDRKIYKAYGVEKSVIKYIKGLMNSKLLRAMLKGFMIGKMENDKTMVPADFLIENGIVKHAYYGKDISDHIPLTLVESFIS